MKKRTPQRISQRTPAITKRVFIWFLVVAIAILGSVLFLRSRAATPYLVLDPEKGTVTAPAVVTDSSASSPKDVIQFKAPPVAKVSSTLTVATWNTKFDNAVNLGTSAKKLMTGAQVAGLQEMHDPAHRTALRDGVLCSSCDYSGYVENYSYDGSSAGSLPIIWKKSLFSSSNTGYLKVSDKVTGINDATGKNMSVSAKYITWVKLKDLKTGISFWLLNTHTVASVEAGGKPSSSNTERVNLYKKHMDALVSKVQALKSDNIPIFVVGDLNVNYRYDMTVQNAIFPYARLGAVNMHSNYQRLNLAGIPSSKGSQGENNRLIDYIYALDRPELASNATNVSDDSMGSDHFPVYYKLTLTKP